MSHLACWLVRMCSRTFSTRLRFRSMPAPHADQARSAKQQTDAHTQGSRSRHPGSLIQRVAGGSHTGSRAQAAANATTAQPTQPAEPLEPNRTTPQQSAEVAAHATTTQQQRTLVLARVEEGVVVVKLRLVARHGVEVLRPARVQKPGGQHSRIRTSLHSAVFAPSETKHKHSAAGCFGEAKRNRTKEESTRQPDAT